MLDLLAAITFTPTPTFRNNPIPNSLLVSAPAESRCGGLAQPRIALFGDLETVSHKTDGLVKRRLKKFKGYRILLNRNKTSCHGVAEGFNPVMIPTPTLIWCHFGLRLSNLYPYAVIVQ